VLFIHFIPLHPSSSLHVSSNHRVPLHLSIQSFGAECSHHQSAFHLSFMFQHLLPPSKFYPTSSFQV
jgi:hypothetical protein